MKTLVLLSLGLALGLSAQAALVKFAISPPGTDVAVGLSPSNMVPPVVNSTGSGDSISAGVIFDTDTSLLHVAIGYGSAAGFTDLTGPATGIGINGPGGTNANAPAQFALTLLNFPALDPATGGVIYGSVSYPTNVAGNPVSNLLAGLHYIVIYTAANPPIGFGLGGEIRGQLIPISEPPVVVCPAPATNECGQSTTLTTLVSDPEGDALWVIWSVNGTPVATNTVPARGPGLPAMTSLTQVFPLGTNALQVTVIDTAGNEVSCSTEIVVLDTKRPVIGSATANPPVLWPPNHQLVNVRVLARVTDTCSDTTWRILRVTSNGPVGSPPDWIITGDHTVKLRAVRSGNAHPRVYTITLQAQDSSGNLSATKSIRVPVARSREDGDHGDGDCGDGDHGDGDQGNGGQGNGHHG